MNWPPMEWIYVLYVYFLLFYWCVHFSSSNGKFWFAGSFWLERILSPSPLSPTPSYVIFCWAMFRKNRHLESGLSFWFFCLVDVVDPACYRARPALFLIYEAVFVSSHLFSPHVIMTPSHRWSAAVVLTFFFQAKCN